MGQSSLAVIIQLWSPMDSQCLFPFLSEMSAFMLFYTVLLFNSFISNSMPVCIFMCMSACAFSYVLQMHHSCCSLVLYSGKMISRRTLFFFHWHHLSSDIYSWYSWNHKVCKYGRDKNIDARKFMMWIVPGKLFI